MKTLFDILSSKDSIIIPLRCHANFTRGFHKSKTKDFNVRYRGGSIIPQHIHFYKGDNSIQICKVNSTKYFKLTNIRSKLFDKNNKRIKDIARKGEYNNDLKKQSLRR